MAQVAKQFKKRLAIREFCMENGQGPTAIFNSKRFGGSGELFMISWYAQIVPYILSYNYIHESCPLTFSMRAVNHLKEVASYAGSSPLTKVGENAANEALVDFISSTHIPVEIHEKFKRVSDPLSLHAGNAIL